MKVYLRTYGSLRGYDVCRGCTHSGHRKGDEECLLRRLEEGEVDEASPELEGIFPCGYCGERTHLVMACPYLFSRCSICAVRGHLGRQCPDYTRSVWLAHFRKWAPLGLLTNSGHGAGLTHPWSAFTPKDMDPEAGMAVGYQVLTWEDHYTPVEIRHLHGYPEIEDLVP